MIKKRIDGSRINIHNIAYVSVIDILHTKTDKEIPRHPVDGCILSKLQGKKTGTLVNMRARSEESTPSNFTNAVESDRKRYSST